MVLEQLFLSGLQFVKVGAAKEKGGDVVVVFGEVESFFQLHIVDVRLLTDFFTLLRQIRNALSAILPNFLG